MKKGRTHNEFLRKIRWYGYINKQRHEEKLLNELESIYGKDAVFIIGDWSNRERIKRISSPCIGMRRLLSKRFKVYLIDEYKTSKIYHKTREVLQKLSIKMSYMKDDKENIYNKLIYSILIFKMGTRRGI